MLLQTITVDEWRFTAYRREPDWISKYMFPGSELASVAEILASLARTTRLSLYHAEQIGTHYARTLHAWRERFHARLNDVRALGYHERLSECGIYTWAIARPHFREPRLNPGAEPR